MKQQLILVIYFTIYLILNSCQGKDEFIRPDFPEKLCIIAIIESEDNERSIIFEKSFQNEFPDEYLDSIRGLTFTITSSNNSLYYYKSEISMTRKSRLELPDSLVFMQGEKYSILSKEISTGEISSEIVVPKAPMGLTVHYIDKALTILPSPHECHSPVNSAILNLSYTAEKNSYYSIVIEGVKNLLNVQYKDCYVEYSIIESNSPSFSSIMPGITSYDYLPCNTGQLFIPTSEYYATFFDGNTIPEGTCNLRIKIDLHQDLFDYTKPIRIKLLSIPYELYLFEKSIWNYRNSLRDPFSEPVYLNGNINGGNGIFAIYSSASISLSLPW
jgi:hypothetical protein